MVAQFEGFFHYPTIQYIPKRLEIMGMQLVVNPQGDGKQISAGISVDGILLVLLGLGPAIHKSPASSNFRSIICALPVTVEPFQFSPAEPVAYELSKRDRSNSGSEPSFKDAMP